MTQVGHSPGHHRRLAVVDLGPGSRVVMSLVRDDRGGAGGGGVGVITQVDDRQPAVMTGSVTHLGHVMTQVGHADLGVMTR